MTAFACPLVSPIDPHPAVTPVRYLSRQPIVDARRRLFGYQLLLGPGGSDDPEQATREMIDHWLLLLPEAQARTVFVRCTRDALVQGLVSLLPPASTVLGIALETAPDADVIAHCDALRRQGYRFSLDSFVPDDPRTPLLDCADFVHMSFPASDYGIRHDIYRAAAGRQILAGNVETEVEMLLLRGEGCSFFHGPFYA